MSSVGTREILPSNVSFLIFCDAADSGRKSATAAAITTASAVSAASATAPIISFAERTRTVRMNGGSGNRVGPATRVTSAPNRRAATAMANPILPLDRFVRNRTGSISSAVGPAPTTTLFPARIFSARRIRAISTIFSVSASRPGPTVPQASSPSSGSTKVNPRSRRTSTFSRTAGEAYIWLFIAGARSTGAAVAITTVESMSSAMPPRIFPRMFAVAGAIIRRFARCAREMCPISDSVMRSNRSV